ncbi:conserved hypothetical protein [Gammaproteobacteria bacterium]
MDLRKTTEDTIARIMSAQKAPLGDDVLRAAGLTQSTGATTGLTFYDLEPAAKLMYPVLTPLRNKIPRVSGKGGIQANWKAITGINVANMRGVVSAGNRGGAISHTLQEYLAAYRGIGLENFVQFEAELAAEGFDNAKALAVQMLLQSTMIEEERLIIGGNTSIALGTTPTPTCSDVATGGTLLANTAYKVGCIALTFEGYKYNTVAAGLVPVVTKTNTDGSTDTFGGGVAKQSAIASISTAADATNTHSIKASVTPVNGAVAYAWYLGTVNAAGMFLYSITTINSVLFTADAAGAQAFSVAEFANDNSKNSLAFDGLYSQIMATGSNAYLKDLATGVPGTGSALTTDGAGGITEISDAFQSFWDNFRLSPDIMYVSGGVALAMNKLIIANGGAPLIRYGLDAQGTGQLDAGVVIGSILNQITNKKVAIVVHPDAVPGSILFYSDGVPYPLSGVGNILQIRARRDYYQIEWPLKTRKYEYGVYADEVLQNYFPPAFGLIKNINYK